MQIELTVPVNVVRRELARASQPIMRAISWTRDLVTRALASFDRSWESLARRHGWVETCALGGSGKEAIAGRGCSCGEDREKRVVYNSTCTSTCMTLGMQAWQHNGRVANGDKSAPLAWVAALARELR